MSVSLSGQTFSSAQTQQAQKNLPSIAFGKQMWETYIGNIGLEPPLPVDIEAILNAPCPFWPEKKVMETHMLTLIPMTVNGRALNLQTLGELVNSPKKGNAAKYYGLYPGEAEDKVVNKSHWALMSRNVIPGTRGKGYSVQLRVLAGYHQPAYEPPHLIDAVASIFMEYIWKGTRVFSDKPWTYTRCQDEYGNSRRTIVGCFDSNGLLVCYHDYDTSRIGLAPTRRF